VRFLRKVCIDYAQGYRFFLKIICQICAGIFEEKEIRKKTCSDGIRQDGKYILWVKWRSQVKTNISWVEYITVAYFV